MTTQAEPGGVVLGRVADRRGRPLAHLLVRAYDRDLRSEELLGECVTGRDGRYQIHWSQRQLYGRGKQTADLALKVLSAGRGHELYTADVDATRFNASAREEINVTIEREVPAEAVEFDAIVQQLSFLARDLPLAELQESARHRDVSFLSREAGIAADKIEHVIVAHRVQAAAQVDADFFYALLRRHTLLKGDLSQPLEARLAIGIETEVQPLLYDAALADEATVRRDVVAAVKQRIVGPRVQDGLERNFKRLRGYRDAAQAYHQTERPRKLMRLVSRFVLEDKLAEMARAFEAGKNQPAAFFDRLDSGSFFPSDDHAQQAQAALALEKLLGLQADALAQIQQAHGITRPEQVRKLARLNRADWKAELGRLPANPQSGRALDPGAADLLASSLVRRMETAYPTTAFAAQLQREKAPLLKHQAAIAEWLSTHDDFDLRHGDVARQLKDDGAGVGVRDELRSLQRVFKLVPHYGKTMRLRQLGLQSAQSISAAGAGRFMREIAPRAGLSAEEAREVFGKAQNTATAAMLIAGELQDTARAAPVPAMEMANLAPALQAASLEFPNLKSLFQGVDACACQHCRSVFSPAAYLVEILQFVGQRSVTDLSTLPPTTGRLAKDVLFARRPDLGDIDLSCENATTPVPYIDLVCELLEEAVSPDAGVAYAGVLSDGAVPLKGRVSNALLAALQAAGLPVTDQAVVLETESASGGSASLPHYLRDREAVCKIVATGVGSYRVYRLRQTLWPAAELAAAPAYVNADAYAALKSAQSAFTLPFDLDHAEARAYFARFNIPRAALMQAFEVAGSPAAADIAAETLGLSPAESALVTQPRPALADQQAVWSAPAQWNEPPVAGDVLAYMTRLDHFLHKTGLGYDDAVALLKLRFIDPDELLFVRHLDLGCDTARKEVAGLDLAALDRVHRLLRLQKKTGWTLATLDEVISQPVLGKGTLDENCLVQAAQLADLAAATGLPVAVLVGFYGVFPPVLYEQVFLDKAKNGAIDERLRPEQVDGSGTIASATTAIAASLQLKERDLQALRALLPDDALSFSHLSRLHAAARLLKALKLGAEAYVLLCEMSGIDPSASPAETLALVQAAADLARSPLDAAAIHFMLAHQAPNLAERELSDVRITEQLGQLQAAYQQNHRSYRSAFDAKRTADEQKEALSIALSRLPGLAEADVRTLVAFVDRQWTSANDAKVFVDARLGAVLSTAPVNAAIDVLAAAPGPDLSADRLALVQTLLAEAASYQLQAGKQALLAQHLASSFKADLELVQAVLRHAVLSQPAPAAGLLSTLLSTDALIDTDPTHDVPVLQPINPGAFADPYRALRLTHKLLPLIQAFDMSPAQVEWLFEHADALGWFRWDAIPYQAGQVAVDYDRYIAFVGIADLWRRLMPVSDPADAQQPVSFQTVAAMLLPASGVGRAAFITAFALLTGHGREAVDSVDAHLFPAFSLASYRDPKTWHAVARCADHLATLGMTTAQVQAVIQPALTAAETGLLRTALKARYDEDTWLGTLKEVMDSLRPLKRDALVAQLLAQNAAMASENDLYDHFLVDVEMCACMPSSRIVQAHGTVQLFVQRCLMGLEHTATADIGNDPSWDQWTWMKNYRVWEANRKVFLYPENWIEPELRDDKSFLFQELENELQQNELTAFTAEQAVVRYLEKLDNIAFLEVMATWYQADIKTMHVFARTKGGDPAIHYYRRFEQERYWTPWEKVEVDISGDHLLAFVRNNRLCLVWPVFSEEPDPNPSSKIPSAAQQGTEVGNDKPRRKLKMQLAISELANRKWQPKRISRDGILTPDGYYSSYDDDFRRDIYNLIYVEPTQQIWLLTTGQEGETEYHTLRGIFDIAGCKGHPELSFQGSVNLPDFLPDFKDARLQAQRYLEQNKVPADELAVRNAISFTQFYDILHKTPGNFRLSYPHQFTLIDLVALLLQLLLRSMYGAAGQSSVRGRSVKLPLGTLLPYFMEDSRHAYVIVPGLYGTQAQEGATPVLVQRTGSNVLQLIQDIVALATKYIAIYAANPDADALVSQLVADVDYQKILAELEVYATLSYGEQFKTLYHPLICSLRKTLYREGLPALMKRETQLQRTAFDFQAWYDPNKAIVPQTYWVEEAGVRSLSYPVEDLDFSSDGAYSGYNWELFFHVPLLVAGKLTKNQRFEEALAWFHHMFNPTGALAGDAPEKYWVTKPFFLTHSADYVNQRIDTLLHKIADPGTPERKELEFAVSQWRDKPFQPHVVARFRPVAYQKALLMKYIDNLTEWGDNLFRQDTMESIVQATQMYILADKLLGPKPRTVPPAVDPVAETYRQIEARLDAFGNALIDLENVLPDLSVLPEGGAELPPPPVTLSMLYFCIPQNDRMLAVWDRIADRLYKIRHCQNIDGVERSLALFAPPIDPAMLVRAAAAGLDLSAVLAGMNAPMPYYRFTVFAQKAAELAMEVRTLGMSLLQALDKQDVEAMALLRNDLELKALNAIRDTKRLHVQEAKEQIEVLKRAKATMEEKRQFYAGLEKIITKEQLNLDKLGESHDFQMASQIVQATAGVLALIPDFAIGASGFGGSPHAAAKWGGSFLAHSATAASGVLNVLSTAASYEANRASILGSYDRRFDEWQFQQRLSRKEIAQIEQQIVVAEIRRDSALSDLASHDVQIENSKKSDEFMRSRFTNKELYDWMVGQLSAVYFKSYQLAFEFAKKAERCYRFELGNDDAFVFYGYWDSMKKGLQSADGLIHDIKRMQTSYLEKNKREYEITKHVSLAQLDPLALVRLRATGATDFELPEVLYDMDHPGQYFRRLKSVAISMPCVIGPYTSVSAKLSMLSNRYRRNTNPDNGAATGYTEDPGNDERFSYNVGAIQSIASSNAQNDTGLFELNFKEDRYLPFEGSGVVGSWRLELPREVRQFNYATISDVVLHVKYTAREGGSSLRTLAEQSLKDRLGAIAQQLGQTGLHVALNLRQDMASDWLQFKSAGNVSLTIDTLRLPYLAQTLDAAVEDVMFVAKVRNNPASTAVSIDGATLNLARVDDWMLCRGITPDIELGTAFTLAMAAGPLADLEDLVLLVKYSF